MYYIAPSLPILIEVFAGGSSGKESAFQCSRCKRLRFDPSVRKISWRRKWQPTLVFMPGKFHEQRSLAIYRPWCHNESNTTVHAHTDTGVFFSVYRA